MNKVLFMVINGEVRFNMDPTADHKEWFRSLGLNEELFDSTVRGFVLDNKIIYYKGNEYKFDEEVIKAAKMYTPYIRFSLQNQTLQAYCGITFLSTTNWEPILKIQENEITGIKNTQSATTNTSTFEAGPLLEIKNNYEDTKFIKTAIIVTLAVLGITVLSKILLFSMRGNLSVDNFADILLAFLQIFFLGLTIFGHLKKKSYTKYTGIIASAFLIFTFHIVDVIVGVLYFLFCVDQHYFVMFIQTIKKLLNKSQKKE